MALWYVSNSGSDSNTGTSQAQAYATIGKALSSAAASDTIAVQTGTYTITSTLNITQATLVMQGYQKTPGDNGTPPLITTATNSTTLINTSNDSGGYWLFKNLSLSNTATTRASGIWQSSPHGTIQTWVFVNVTFDGFAAAIDSSDGTPDDVGFIHVTNCEVKNSTVVGLASGGSTTFLIKIFASYFHANAQHVSMGSGVGPLWLERTIFAGSTASLGLNINPTVVLIDGCTFANNTNTSATVSFSSTNTFMSITNNIFYGNTSGLAIEGYNANTGAAGQAGSGCNAYGNNSGVGWSSPGDVTLTANPFTNAGSGDYSLNSTSGGGAACKGAGLPGAFQGGTTTGHPDIGAVQSSSGGGGGGNVAPVVSIGMCGGMRG